MKNIVFIHGMFMNPKSWDKWVKYFEKADYSCSAPPYPFHDGEPSGLRGNIPGGLGKLDMPGVLEVFRNHLKDYKTKPVLIGHSMGGAIAQTMVNEGWAEAGVCIDSAPVADLLSFKWSFLKSNLPVINPFKGDAPYLMSPEHFRYTFCNTMGMEETKKAYEAHVVPESRNIPRTAGAVAKIDFEKEHAPLLFIAGERDNIIPASLNERNWKKYVHKESITDFKQFAGRTHYICGQDGWEEVAGYVEGWIKKNTNEARAEEVSAPLRR